MAQGVSPRAISESQDLLSSEFTPDFDPRLPGDHRSLMLGNVEVAFELACTSALDPFLDLGCDVVRNVFSGTDLSRTHNAHKITSISTSRLAATGNVHVAYGINGDWETPLITSLHWVVEIRQSPAISPCIRTDPPRA